MKSIPAFLFKFVAASVFASALTLALALPLSSTAFAAESKLVFDVNVDVATPTTDGLTNKSTIAAGKDVIVDTDKLLWIESKGRVPLLLVPTRDFASPSGPPKIKLPEVAAWAPLTVDQEIERRMVALVDDLQSFQQALGRRDMREAEAALNRIETSQPMTYTAFLRASLEFVKGNFTGARTNVERGLKKYPANIQGQKLLKALEESKR